MFDRPQLGRDTFDRGDPEAIEEIKRPEWSATLYDLLSAYARERQKQALAHVRFAKRTVWSLVEARARWNAWSGYSATGRGSISFLIAYVVDPKLRTTAMASSLAATLELVREGQIELHQHAAFAPIYSAQARSRSTAGWRDPRPPAQRQNNNNHGARRAGNGELGREACDHE